MDNLLETLRYETSQLHQGLHVHPILKSCQEGTISKTEYLHLLKAFYSPWKTLAPAIDIVPIEALKPKLQSREQAIRDDLMKLNVDQKIFDPIIPQPTISMEELLGMCYVLVGSSMGGSILSAKIKETLGDVPVSYLSMSPKDAGWPELVGKLRSLKSEGFSGASIGACAAFEKIDNELTVMSTN